MTVSELLTASMAAHRRALPTTKAGRPKGWLDHLKEAASLRKQAEALDPGFRDEAWQFEQKHTSTGVNTHAVLMAFYESKGLING